MKSYKQFVAEAGFMKKGTRIEVKNALHAVNWLNKEFKKAGSKNFATMASKTEVELTDVVAGYDVDLVDRYLDEFGGRYTRY